MTASYGAWKDIVVRTYEDGATTYVHRRRGPDYSLPPIIFAHGSGGTGYDITGFGPSGSAGPAMATRGWAHAIRAGYRLYANNVGGTKAWCYAASQTDMDPLYTLAGTSTVIVSCMSMGGTPSLLWVANNASKVAGWVGHVPAMNLQWMHDGTDGLGNTTTSFATDIEAAAGGSSAYTSSLSTRNPMAGAQLTSLIAQKSKLHVIYGTSDGFINPVHTAANIAAIGCSSTALSGANHDYYDGPTWDDSITVQRLDAITGRH